MKIIYTPREWGEFPKDYCGPWLCVLTHIDPTLAGVGCEIDAVVRQIQPMKIGIALHRARVLEEQVGRRFSYLVPLDKWCPFKPACPIGEEDDDTLTVERCAQMAAKRLLFFDNINGMEKAMAVPDENAPESMLEEWMRDALTDMMHLCDMIGEDFADILTRAQEAYEEESADYEI